MKTLIPYRLIFASAMFVAWSALAASVFTSDTEVAPPDPAQYQFFGGAVAISGDTAVVGANKAAYVYVRQRTGWVLQQKLLPSDSEPSPEPNAFLAAFGGAVAIEGDELAVAAPNWVTEPTKTGAVFVFRRVGNGWVRR